MAVSTPFERDPAHTSGRLRPRGGAVAGDWSFVLGSDLPGQVFPLSVGDRDVLSQVVDVTGLSRIAFSVRLRGPAADPAPRAWRFSWRVDGVSHGSRVVRPGRTVTVTDGVFDVSQLTGSHTLSFRLEVE